MTAVPQPTVRLSDPADFIAIVPYMLGFHPTLSIVAMVFDMEAGSLHGVLRFDLPERSADVSETLDQFTGILTRDGARHALLIGYGPGDRVTPVVDAMSASMSTAGIQITDMLRCDNGRYWSYTCVDPACCPPDGTPYDLLDSRTAAEAVLAGLVALPDRDALRATLAPVDGPVREQMREATRVARCRAKTLIGTAGGHPWYQEGRDRIATALDRTQAGEELAPDEIAWLGVLLTAIFVRDTAMTFIGEYSDHVHFRLWTEITRKVEPGYAAAPAALLAFVALRTGDGPLARIAVDRALADDPGYRLAGMIGFALDQGLPPSVAAGMDCPAMAEEVAERAEQNPHGARPVLPEGR
ncbi:DUF4192 domain-containing protein [Streptosporangium sp. KLBMP 9127]|nr:DUF4192 domain-containing protein [Streptosporangium sp. KLBMP 9127]